MHARGEVGMLTHPNLMSMLHSRGCLKRKTIVSWFSTAGGASERAKFFENAVKN